MLGHLIIIRALLWAHAPSSQRPGQTDHSRLAQYVRSNPLQWTQPEIQHTINTYNYLGQGLQEFDRCEIELHIPEYDRRWRIRIHTTMNISRIKQSEASCI
ncbi:hypothetical protein KC19_VG198900 [Ceratodon purpureus]|uniref:Uncharacterized protein n=1 Tax=Ceratodon purpureus TaxID=3225 RepID=A0A8T0HT24_CERPU|nr:hypothetical protein KC19_VG198900 [Ceratodon purpureus]